MIPRRWNPRAILLFLGMAAYAPALSTGFLYDDHFLIESNPSLRSWAPHTLKQDFISGMFHHPRVGTDFYRPLQTFSTRTEYTLWGLQPFPYHLTNLLFHLGNVLLLYEVLLVLGTGALAAGLTGALFAVHPIIVEDLLMVSGRGELMGLFFTLACFFIFLRSGRGTVVWGVLSYILAVFSKESAVVVPVLLAAVFYYKREPRHRYILLVPLLAITALYLGLRHYAMGPLPDWRTMYPGRFILIAFPQILIGYLRILLLPIDLHTDRLLSLPFHAFWPAATLVVSGTALGLGWKGPRWALLCVIYYILIFLPKSVLMMSGSFMSDHWAYPALPAVALPIALALARGGMSPQLTTRRLAQGAAGALVAASMALTLFNICTRNSDEKLYRSALRHTSSSTLTYNLGMMLFQQGRFQEALPYFETLVATDPQNSEAVQARAETRAALSTVGKRP